MTNKHERNPYDFVPLEGPPSYVTAVPTQARLAELSGTIGYTLEVLTPLCIHHEPGNDREKLYEFAHLNNKPAIPATSLKGMLRSVHEVVTNSTMGLLQSGQKARYSHRVPDSYRPGETLKRLTPSETLFGMVGGKGDDSVGMAGRLFLHDIPITVALVPQGVSRPRGGMPKPAHESFYFERANGGSILGRKFYYHQQDYRRVAQIYRKRGIIDRITVQSVPEGTALAGTLRFFNLSKSDLCALVYTLVLESHLAHKLGYGKPLGLGSVRLHITRLEVERTAHLGEDEVPARLLSYGAPARDDWTDRVAELSDAAKAAWLQRPDGQRSYDAFVALACWPQRENFIYPDFKAFFDVERGKQKKTTLWAYQGRAAMHPAGCAPPPGLPAVLPPPPLTTPTANSPTHTTPPPDRSTQQSAHPTAPPKPKPQHRTGQLVRSGETYSVRDDKTGEHYTCTIGVPENMRKRVNAGKTVRVSFRPEGQIAQDITLLEGDA